MGDVSISLFDTHLHLIHTTYEKEPTTILIVETILILVIEDCILFLRPLVIYSSIDDGRITFLYSTT